MRRDHRQNYSPTQMYYTGLRFVGDYDLEDAIADYMKLHPEADDVTVRKELTDFIRSGKSPEELLLEGRRAGASYRPEDAVAAYREAHPDQPELDVWEALRPHLKAREAARAAKRVHKLMAELTPGQLWERLKMTFGTIGRRDVEIEYQIYNPKADYGAMMRQLDAYEAERHT